MPGEAARLPSECERICAAIAWSRPPLGHFLGDFALTHCLVHPLQPPVLMKKIEAIIKPHRLDEVMDQLRQAGVSGMTISDVKGFGRTGGRREVYRGSAYFVDFVPKVRIEILIKDEMLHAVVVA